MGSFLQQDRHRLGLTAVDVIKKISASRTTYTRWEAGAPIPSDKLGELASIGFDIHFVVTGEFAKPEVSDMTRAIRVVTGVLGDVWDDMSADDKAELICQTYNYFKNDDVAQTTEEQDVLVGNLMKEVLTKV
ncbi:helix-turn-helix domain-containing protein [Thalassotalea loyana]|nr:helix-turn-helix transcriptional regulator [Thalassotalea loyana]